jgi:cytochrome c biogenesis protein CcmG/thiol:disulfide interchange protein DsbE
MPARIFTALAVVGSLLAIALVVRSGGVSSGPAAPKVNLSQVLEDMNGGKVDLAGFAGRPMIINLWATWCGPCRLETPQLVALADKFRDKGLVVIGISVDDTPDVIRAFAAEYHVTYPMLVGIGQDAFLRSVGYQDVLPFSVLVSKDGTIVSQVTGLKTTAAWERSILGILQ